MYNTEERRMMAAIVFEAIENTSPMCGFCHIRPRLSDDIGSALVAENPVETGHRNTRARMELVPTPCVTYFCDR